MRSVIERVQVQDVGAERDAITQLRAPTHFGRPNWDRVFNGVSYGLYGFVWVVLIRTYLVVDRRSSPWYRRRCLLLWSCRAFKDVGDFDVAWRSSLITIATNSLHVMSNKYTTPKGTRFFFGKGEQVITMLQNSVSSHTYMFFNRELLSFASITTARLSRSTGLCCKLSFVG